MALRTEKTSDGLKLRDTKTGKLAGAVSTKGKAAPKTLDSKNLPGTATTAVKTSSDIEAMYAQYAAAESALPKMESPLLELYRENEGEYYVHHKEFSELFASIDSGDGGDSWNAVLLTRCMDDEIEDLDRETFTTFEEAQKWVDTNLSSRVEEEASFESKWATNNPLQNKKDWDERKKEHDFFWEEEISVGQWGTPVGYMNGASRGATINSFPYDENEFTVEVKDIDDKTLHLRSFETFDKAYAFATEMTLIIDDVEW